MLKGLFGKDPVEESPHIRIYVRDSVPKIAGPNIEIITDLSELEENASALGFELTDLCYPTDMSHGYLEMGIRISKNIVFFYEREPIPGEDVDLESEEESHTIPIPSGFAMVDDFAPGELAKLTAICVDHTTGKKGYGGKIMQVVEKLAKDDGASGIVMDAFNTAVGFYTKIGYVPTGTKGRETGPNEVQMKKMLGGRRRRITRRLTRSRTSRRKRVL
jgi:GNAT superfamily N-acetyltransferase